jgi:ankyrin repeat protein
MLVALFMLLLTKPSAASLISLVAKGDTAKVARMLAKGTDANKPDQYGTRPLEAAATRCDIAMVSLLLAGGADAHQGQVLAQAIRSTLGTPETRLEIVRLLLKTGASVGSSSALLADAISSGQDSIAFVLLDAGAPADGDPPPLIVAAENRNVAVCEALLGRGANPDRIWRDPSRPVDPIVWALEVAASRGSTSVVRLLLEHGANPNQARFYMTCTQVVTDGVVTRDDGELSTWTALDSAELDKHAAVQSELLAHGARERLSHELGPGAFVWAAPILVGGHTSRLSNDGARGSRVAIGFQNTFTSEDMRLFAALLRQHGIPDAMIRFCER